MKNLFYILLGIVFSINSCRSNKTVIGKYATKKYPDKFQFKKDSTFIYQFGAVELFMYATGNWKKINYNTIELSSKIKSVSIPWKTFVQNNMSKDSESKLSIKLQIIGKLSLADYKCWIFLNDELFKIKRCDSLSNVSLSLSASIISLQFTREPIEENETSYVAEPLRIDKIDIKPQAGKTVVIVATVIDSFFYYKPFDSEVIKLGHNSIKFYDSNRKRYERIPKIAEDANVFSRFRMDE